MFSSAMIHSNLGAGIHREIAGNFWHTNSVLNARGRGAKKQHHRLYRPQYTRLHLWFCRRRCGGVLVNIALGPALPDRTPGPGDDPGATPPPRDTRTNEEQRQSGYYRPDRRQRGVDRDPGNPGRRHGPHQPHHAWATEAMRPPALPLLLLAALALLAAPAAAEDILGNSSPV